MRSDASQDAGKSSKVYAAGRAASTFGANDKRKLMRAVRCTLTVIGCFKDALHQLSQSRMLRNAHKCKQEIQLQQHRKVVGRRHTDEGC